MQRIRDLNNGSRVPLFVSVHALASISTILLTISDTTQPDTTTATPPLWHHHTKQQDTPCSISIQTPIPPPSYLQDVGHDIVSKVLQSQLGLIAAANLCISLWLLLALATKHIFLGLQPISLIESATLADRLLKFIMVKIVFLATMPDPAVNGPHNIIDWTIWLAVFGFFRLFLCLAVARCETLLSSTTSQPHQHIRCLALILGILVHDVTWIVSYVKNMRDAPMTMTVLWLFDAVVVAVEAVHALVRYAIQSSLHSYNCGNNKWIIELRHFYTKKKKKKKVCLSSGDDEDRPEEEEENDDDSDNNTSVILFHLDLGVDLLIGLLTLLHYGHLWWLHGLRCQLIDAVLFLDVRFLGGNIYNRIKGYYRYRILTRQLQDGLPTATPEQLGRKNCCDDAHENGGGCSIAAAATTTADIKNSYIYSCNAECAVCMEANNTRSKVLPCGHIFHLNCVRGWLQQSKSGKFTCPLCRKSLPTDVHINKKKKGKDEKKVARKRIYGSPPHAHRVLDLHKDDDSVMPYHHYNSSLNSDGEGSSSSTMFGMMVSENGEEEEEDTVMSTLNISSHRYNTRFRFRRLRTGRG